MTRWLIVAVLVAPLAVLPVSSGLHLAETKNYAFLFAGAGVVLHLVRNGWVRAFSVAAVLGYVLAGAPVWALSGVLGVLAWALLFQQAATLSPTSWRKVRLAIVASAGVQVAWMGVQWAGRDPLFNAAMTQGLVLPASTPISGFFGNPMDLALYLGVSLPFLAAAHPLLALVTAAAMAWWLPTTMGALAIGITALWMARHVVQGWLTRSAAAVTVAAALAGYLVLFDQQTLAFDHQGVGLKAAAWAEGLRAVAERPWIGWGPNALDHRVFLVTPRYAVYWNFLFNEWIQGALELGVLAPVCALGFAVSLVRRLRGRIAEVGALAPAALIIAVASLVSIPFRIGPVALLAALVFGRLDRRLA